MTPTAIEYTVHFQKGSRVGARSTRMVHVEAESSNQAVGKAKAEFADWKRLHYRIVRIDHFEGNHIVLDY